MNEITITITTDPISAEKIINFYRSGCGHTAAHTIPAEPTESAKPARKKRAKKAAEPEPEPEPGLEITTEDLHAALRETLDTVGDVPTRAVFKKFGAAKLSDIGEDQRAAFIKALQATRDLAS